MAKVKICGLTRPEDAMAAAEAGADALGFMFYRMSARFVELKAAAEMAQRLPPFVAKVGVFVDPTEDEVRRAVMECGLDTLQFHGSEPPEFCARFAGTFTSELPSARASAGAWPPMAIVKAFRIRDAGSLDALRRYPLGAWLLDSYVPGHAGGTGEKFNWDWAVQAGQLGRPIILAGGLTPQNVAEAVRQVRPYAVDVSSGVESAPGRKDHEKVREFIRAAKSA